jgi:hypothetical protein
MTTAIGDKKVFFVSHDASRSGAPIGILHLLGWLGSNSDLPFYIMLPDGGVLEPDSSALAMVLKFRASICGSTANRSPGTSNRIGFLNTAEKIYLDELTTRLKREGLGFVHASTVENDDVLKLLAGLRCPVIRHVHFLSS